MKHRHMAWWTASFIGLLGSIAAPTLGREIVFEVTSPYHHIQVADHKGMRILHFDASTQSRMSLDNPLEGHFEYTEYFHMPWLWNDRIENVLMIGLGGSSIQRAFATYYPEVRVETVELDPKVVEVARRFFHFRESANMKVFLGDGRQHLRRTQQTYDLIILDAYTANRYGSYIPYTLATKEFFKLVRQRLTPEGVLAYNVIGSVSGRRKSLVGSLYRTVKTSFPQVYLFSAASSYNVVMVATVTPQSLTPDALAQIASALHRHRKNAEVDTGANPHAVIFWSAFIGEMIPAHFRSERQIRSICEASLRSALIDELSDPNNAGLYTTTEVMDDLAELVDFDDAFRREMATPTTARKIPA